MATSARMMMRGLGINNGEHMESIAAATMAKRFLKEIFVCGFFI